MLDNYLADLKASLTASPIVEDIDITDEFITSVSGLPYRATKWRRWAAGCRNAIRQRQLGLGRIKNK